MIYHASGEVVEFPEIRKSKYAKDFSWGFYCTDNYVQASRWAKRNRKCPTINKYIFKVKEGLNIKKFENMSDEWLDFIAKCRAGGIHDFDIVEGPMADDTVWNYVNDFLSGNISRKAFWELAKFKTPTHQISFHTLRAIDCLFYEGSLNINE